MRTKLLFPAVLAGLLCLSACEFMDAVDPGRFTRDFHYSYPLQADGKLSVDTFNGSIEVSTWDQATVDISGTKYARTQDAADNLKVDIDHAPTAISIRVPRHYDNRNHEGARFVIKVPRTVVLDRLTSSNGAIRIAGGAGPARLKTSNGQIRVQAFRGDVDAETSNGSIELVDVHGDATAHTSNGHIRADGLQGTLDANTSNSGVHAEILGSKRPVRIETSNGPVELTLPNGVERELRVNTNNGGITVRLPSSANARVMAHTSNSSITTDFDVAMRGEMDKHSMDATIGSGGPLIDLTTSNGGIRLLKM